MPGQHRYTWTLCEWCGRPMKVRANDIKRGRGRFCGKRCASTWLIAERGHPVIGTSMPGEQNPNWKGGRVKHCKGYIYTYAPGHPRAHGVYVLEHRLVAEQKLGRLLKPEEVVHHRQAIRDKNEPENLLVFASPGAHSRFEARKRRAAKLLNAT